MDKKFEKIDDLREEFHLMFRSILYYPQIANIEKLNQID